MTAATGSQHEFYRALARMFPSDETIWLTNERRDEARDAWVLDVVRVDGRGIWMRQRYRYDAAASVLYFLGTAPVSEAELPAIRAAGRRFVVAALAGTP